MCEGVVDTAGGQAGREGWETGECLGGKLGSLAVLVLFFAVVAFQVIGEDLPDHVFFFLLYSCVSVF